MKILRSIDGKEIELGSEVMYNSQCYILKGVMKGMIWLKGIEGSIDVLPEELGIIVEE